MLATAYYFLQVVICSGLMTGYYWLVLRNKRFHQYNRFYLLIITLLAWIVPLVKIQWNHQQSVGDAQLMQLLAMLASNNARIDQSIATGGIEWRDLALIGLYCVVTASLLFMMIRALVRIYHLVKTHSCKNVGDVYLILTQAKGTPFSFFRYIFWNEEIDIRSEAGKQILKHELTHVQQKHSVDKMFMQLVLIVGWFNPFFWLIKREMEMIHEFIADKKAVDKGDTASLAQMLLTAAYPNQHFALTHPFFFSPIKRRLEMLTNNSQPRFSYIRRLVVLPLLAIVIVLFAFRNKEQRINATISIANVIENIKEDIVPTRIRLSPVSASGQQPQQPDTGSIRIRATAWSIDKEAFTGTPDTLIVNPKTGKTEVKFGIRGVLSNVLVFVDGVRTTNQVLETMDPNTIKDVTILKDPKVLSVYGKDGEHGVVLINTKNAAGASLSNDFNGSVVAKGNITATTLPINAETFKGTLKAVTVNGVSDTVSLKSQPLIFVNGIKFSEYGLNSINAADIRAISVLKAPQAIEKYGIDGINGVVDISLANPIMPTQAGRLTNLTVVGKRIEGRVKSVTMQPISGGVVQQLSITGVSLKEKEK
jgi:hypothetical protein